MIMKRTMYLSQKNTTQDFKNKVQNLNIPKNATYALAKGFISNEFKPAKNIPHEKIFTNNSNWSISDTIDNKKSIECANKKSWK